MKYMIELSYQAKCGLPHARTVIRDDDDAAIDSAKRLLRLSRNAAHPRAPKFDRWAVYKRFGEAGIILLAHGTPE